jgi:uncharacterized protein (TIGR02001 family)
MLKKVLPAAIAASLLAGATATTVQAGEISANVALTSDYRFRGISQSNEDIAIQGGFDYAWDNGIYIGTWGSSVDFDSTTDTGFNGSLELDYYIGWGMDVGENSAIDVGYLYYDYPGDSSAGEGDYQELYGSFSWHGLTVGINYSDDYYGETDSFFYYHAGYSWGFAENWSLDLHVGYNDFDEEGFFNTDEDGYTDYSVGVTASYLAVDWTLTYIGTTLDEEDAWDTDWAEDTVVFAVSKSF